MLFKGRLRLPDDAGEGIPISVTLEDVYLSLDSQGEEFGEWRLDVVEISRLFSNQFSFLLDGEEMVFIADDALGFAYEGVTFVEDVQSRLKKRRFFKGRKPKRSKAKRSKAKPEPEPQPEPRPATPASAPVEDVPMPQVQPFFPEPAPSAQTESPEAPPQERSPSPPAPSEPVRRPAAEEPAARRGVHPLGDPDAEPVEAHLGESTAAREDERQLPEPWRTAGPEVEPAPRVEPAPAAESTPVAEPAPAAASAPAQEPAPEVSPPTGEESDEEDELVIEDVNPYGYQAPVSMAPESEAAPDDEPIEEIETAETAQAAAIEAPALDDVRTPTEEIPAEPEEPESLPEPEPDVVSEPPVEVQPEAAAEVEPEPQVEVEPVTEAEPAQEPEAELETQTTPRAGRHAKSESKSLTSLFGRRKSKEPEPHDHVYESSKTVGGITRSVCSICGHVSFAGEDVYQSW